MKRDVNIERMLRNLLPPLLLVALLFALLVRQHNLAGKEFFLSDAAYGHAAVARTFMQSGVFGYRPDQPTIATQGLLWRLLIAVAGKFTGNVVSAATLLGGMLVIGVILLLTHLARRLYDFLPFILMAGILLILSPPFLTSAMEGTSLALVLFLSTAAFFVYVRGVINGRPLSLTLAFLVGLMAMVEIELAGLWLVFWLHQLLLNLAEPKQRTPAGLVRWLLRGVQGILVLAICIYPLLLRNVMVLRVPWPRMPDAALVSVKSILVTLPHAYGLLNKAPFMSSPLGYWLFWLGVAVLLTRAFHERPARIFTVVLLAVFLLPLVAACTAPILGRGGLQLVIDALGPPTAIVASYGIFRSYTIIAPLLQRAGGKIAQGLTYNVWWTSLATLLILASLADLAIGIGRRMNQVEYAVHCRRQLRGAIADWSLLEKRYVTDMGGWTAYSLRGPVLDLEGEAYPRVLTAVSGEGGYDRRVLLDVISRFKPDVLLIGDSRFASIQSLLVGHPLFECPAEQSAGYPKLIRIDVAP